MLSLSAQNSKHRRFTPIQSFIVCLAILSGRNAYGGEIPRVKVVSLLPLTFFFVFFFLPYTLYLIPCTSAAHAASSVTVAWDKNDETDVIGYKFHYGTVSKNYQHTVDVENNTSCTISGLVEGTKYYFAAKAYNDKNIESSYSEELAYTIPGTPPPPPIQYALAVDTIGDGSVELDPPGGTYNEGTVVQLTAVAWPGSAFDSWSEDITGAANRVTITMNADKTVTAIFEAVAVPQFTLTADIVGDGSVELNPPGGTYNEGTVVELTAVADPGSALDSWSVDITGSANPVTITMNADIAVTAIFEEVPQFTLTADTVGEGSVELNPSGGTYNEGTVVQLTAVADPGSAFEGWSGDITGAANPVSITVDADMTATSNFEAVPLPQFTLALEIGDIKLNHNWVRVNFKEAFVDPVVVAKPISLNGSHPAVIRISNVDSEGFDIRIQEWDYLDGGHAQETVSYLVMEKGNFTLDDGTQVEAGRLETDNTGSFGKFNFYQSFPETPVVLAGVSSFNEPDAVTGRLRNISNQGFEFCMQEQELNPKEHLSETVDYIAWQPSIGNLNGYTFEVNKTANKVKNSFFTIEFEQPFGRVPFFLADMQTTDGKDTANVRWQNKKNSSVEVQIDEEKSKNSETGHTTEVVGYIVFAY